MRLALYLEALSIDIKNCIHFLQQNNSQMFVILMTIDQISTSDAYKKILWINDQLYFQCPLRTSCEKLYYILEFFDF